MGRWTLVLGGARSGKSAFAVQKAKQEPGEVVYLASAVAVDPEIEERIARHRASRPAHWRTVEEPLRVAGALQVLGSEKRLILWDCVTFYLNNLLHQWEEKERQGNDSYPLEELEKDILREVGGILSFKEKMPADLLIVSNEVGLGIVPEDPSTRFFRDVAGKVNQMIAQKADEVYFMTAGIPLRVK